MGTWSEDIFGNDMACDVRDAYRERIKVGNDAAAAFKLIKKEFAEELREADVKRTIFIALAAAQLEAGEIIDPVRETALKAIAWCEHPQRDQEFIPFGQETLAQLREKLGGKAPPPRKPPKPKVAPGEAGDVLALPLPGAYTTQKKSRPDEVVIFVAGSPDGMLPPDCGLVVMLPSLAVADVTPESVVRALSAWKYYRNAGQPNGSLARGAFCYYVSGKLPPRKTRLLLRDVQMPEGFAQRMRRYAKGCSSFRPEDSKMFPYEVDFDVAHWPIWKKWVVDPEIEGSK